MSHSYVSESIKLADEIIGTKKILLEENDKAIISKKISDLQNSLNIKEHLWNARTNQPYKNIITDPKLIAKFYNGEKATKTNYVESDLIVHTVKKGESKESTEKLKVLMNEIVDHNNELKRIYSSKEKEKHYTDFERAKIFGKKVNIQDHETKKEIIKKEINMITEKTKEKVAILNIIGSHTRTSTHNIVFSSNENSGSTVLDISPVKHNQIKKREPVIIQFK